MASKLEEMAELEDREYLKRKLSEFRGEKGQHEDIGSLEESLLVMGFDLESGDPGFGDIPAVQTLDPGTVKRLREEVQKIRLNEGGRCWTWRCYMRCI